METPRGLRGLSGVADELKQKLKRRFLDTEGNTAPVPKVLEVTVRDTPSPPRSPTPTVNAADEPFKDQATMEEMLEENARVREETVREETEPAVSRQTDTTRLNGDAGDSVPPPPTVGESLAQADGVATARFHLYVKSHAIADRQGSAVRFLIGKTTPLQKLFDAYCSHRGRQFSQLRFMADGNPIKPDATAEKLGLENEGIIHVFSWPWREEELEVEENLW